MLLLGRSLILVFSTRSERVASLRRTAQRPEMRDSFPNGPDVRCVVVFRCVSKLTHCVHPFPFPLPLQSLSLDPETPRKDGISVYSSELYSMLIVLKDYFVPRSTFCLAITKHFGLVLEGPRCMKAKLHAILKVQFTYVCHSCLCCSFFFFHNVVGYS